ncbi:glycosyltransferase family 2 protein [Leptolyngbya sp. NIES-2104]|uniref:glycosyltransferase family 2 protein n=1 Tax=Leptolyngbya sp. NIES-2104 TaxID=1552121 RepID=UPI0006EC8CA3|nr:glycosyltransferase family A protein [Leptolyngbya sp. NIES-2104]GAP99859.1 hypothetical protein NIES2104_64250 [Leptolyngbya sp. NIES-2104]
MSDVQISLVTATHLRAQILQQQALPSILNQTDMNFEWIVINDGCDAQTRSLIKQLQAPCSIVYLEFDHPATGFGLCHARNLGIEAASNSLIAYLDDDNTIVPHFIEQTHQFFSHHPDTRYSMAVQQRQRNVEENGTIVRAGQPFLSPPPDCTLTDLIEQRSLFDSNGFTHYRENAPRWNPEYKVFADYEYLLQCVQLWGREPFKLQSQPLVQYIQSSMGVIGRSTYSEWADELQSILESRDDHALTESEMAMLTQSLESWRFRATPISAFQP